MHRLADGPVGVIGDRETFKLAGAAHGRYASFGVQVRRARRVRSQLLMTRVHALIASLPTFLDQRRCSASRPAH